MLVFVLSAVWNYHKKKVKLNYYLAKNVEKKIRKTIKNGKEKRNNYQLPLSFGFFKLIFLKTSR